MAKELGGWQMQKTADALKPGDRIIFSEAMGGEGQVLTVDTIANYFGTVDITTLELDFDLSASENQWISIDLTEDEEDPAAPEPLWPLPKDSEYIERRDKLAEFLCDLVYGNGAWGEAEKNTQLNYRLDADEIIKANPHLLSLAERERLADTIPELKLKGEE
jgi:hypothetical protein